MNKNNKKIIENITNKKKKVSENILPSQKEISFDNEIWTTSIEHLKSKNFTKLSEAINGLVDEVINRLNFDINNEDLRLFLHEMCTDNASILEVIEHELL